MSIIEKLFFKMKTGYDIRQLNNGKPVEQLVIRYKDMYFDITLDAKTGKPTGDFAWSNDLFMHNVKVRDIYVATRIKLKKTGEKK